MSVFHNPALLGSSGSSGYKIERSLRFSSGDSSYLNRTPASAGNRKIYTISMWIKRAKLGASSRLFGAYSSASAYFEAFFTSSDALQWYYWNGSGYSYNRVTSQVFRDPSAWCHLVFVFNSPSATGSQRIRIYFNGQEITTFSSSTDPSQNFDCVWNSTANNVIGDLLYGGSPGSTFDGLMAEVHHIDGQALTPSSFGETNPVTGVWQPKAFSGGSYGTNGFYLKFADNSGATSTTLGKDSSPNGNNFTPNNFSVTAGSGNDSMIDTPTPYADGGNGRGNYATLNPLDNPNTTYAFAQDGNLLANLGTGVGTFLSGTMHTLGGKYYWEFTPTTVGNGLALGITYGSTTTTDANSKAIFYALNGGKRIFGTDSAYGASYTNGDVIGVAVNSIAGTIEFFKNNTSQGVITDSSISLQPFRPFVFNNSSSASSLTVCNFGQRSFSYTPPSGFLALNTQNLPEPTIKKPSVYMDVVTYTGNGSTQTITGLNFNPDFVWFKSRSSAYNHALVDSVRGVDKYLYSSLTIAEETQTNAVSSFNTNGFSFAGPFGNVNNSGSTYAAWCWDKSATPGFDIVTYTGNGSNRTIAHSLGVAPSMMIVKRRDSSPSEWWVYHSVLGATKGLALNSISAEQTSSLLWNNTVPTSSVFSLGVGSDVNGSGGTYVAYLWSEVASFSKFGSYVGNGSSDGPFVYCGFRPRWVMFKRSDGASNWMIIDAARNTANVIGSRLFPDVSDAESSGGTTADFTANGFKLRGLDTPSNGSTGTYIFAAFAESPFKYSLAR